MAEPPPPQPPGLAPVQTLVMQSHLAAHQRKFILEEGGMGYSNVKVVKSHRKISSDLFAKGIEKFKAFIPFAEEGCLEAIPFGHPA